MVDETNWILNDILMCLICKIFYNGWGFLFDLISLIFFSKTFYIEKQNFELVFFLVNSFQRRGIFIEVH